MTSNNGEEKVDEIEYPIEGIAIINGKWYVDKESYDGAWELYGDLLDKAAKLYDWFEGQGIDVDKLLESLPDRKDELK